MSDPSPLRPAFISSEEDGASDSMKRWKLRAQLLSLALLLHLLLLLLNPSWNIRPAPPPVKIEQVDSKKLEAIRRQWAKNDQSLLLNKDSTPKKDIAAPKDARYQSDRNIRVNREQRARQTEVIPKSGGSAQSESKSKMPRITQLGVPLNLDRRSPQPAGRDQALLDKNLPLGSENLLNAQESIYYSFYARLYEAIAPIWQSYIRQVPFMRRVPAGEYTTAVEVVFDRAGKLLTIRQIGSSGISEFDNAVPASWNKIGNFPNPPSGLLNELGQVHTGWTFTVNVNQNAGLEYLPPERVY